LPFFLKSAKTVTRKSCRSAALHIICRGDFMKIRISPSAALMLCVLAAGRDAATPALLLGALWHECGHLWAARRLGVPLRLLELDLFGARLYPKGQIPSYKAEALLAAAGPVASLLLWGLMQLFSAPFPALLGNTSLALGLFNLMPVSGFDGGRMLFALLATWRGERAAERILAVCSYFSLLFLFALASCLLLRLGQHLSLAVLAASLFVKTFLPTSPT
jgi:Zn-dependent protease